MSERPPRPRPLIPGPAETAVLFWRWLRRMRTALYLLGTLGVAVLLATVIPQRPNVPDTVSSWMSGREGPGASVAGALDTLGLYDVFATPWFIGLLVLLFTSLTACLIPRIGAFWRTARHGRPPLARDLTGRSHAASFTTALDADEAVRRARQVLDGERYRTRTDGAEDIEPVVAPTPVRSDPTGAVVPAPADDTSTTWSRSEVGTSDVATPSAPRGRQVAGEKGHIAREGGSLAFHLSFFAILIGVVLGELLSFSGQVGVVEGQAFSDTRVAYWTADAGRWWTGDDHTGFLLHLDDFEVEWTDLGLPVGFTSQVTLSSSDGSVVREETTVVNDPIVFEGMKIHQLDWGWSPRIVVEAAGEVVHDAHVTMSATDRPGVWRGVVKAPAARPQIGVELFLFPSAPEDENGELVPTGRPEPHAPAIVYQVWKGDLQLDSAQGVDQLDTTRMTPVARGGLRPGSGTEVADGVTVRFPELDQWVGFQVSRRPTVPLLLAAATVLLVGLLPALYAYRRRIWVEAVPDEGTDLTRVTVAGHTYQRPQAFDDEFGRLVDALEGRLESGPSQRDRTREVVPR